MKNIDLSLQHLLKQSKMTRKKMIELLTANTLMVKNFNH